MTPSVETAQSRAEAQRLTGAKLRLTEANRADPERLRAASALTLAVALSGMLAAIIPWALLLTLPLLALLITRVSAMRWYFVAFSARNEFPRNLPAFARWAALYSGVMLIMIALPPSLTPALRIAIWCALAGATLLFPLLKAWHRASKVWAPD